MSKPIKLKKFAVFDIDGTLYRDALFHDAVRELEARGYLAQKHVLAVNKAWEEYKERLHDEAFKVFSDSRVSAFIDAMHKISKDELNKITNKVIDQKKNYVYTYTKSLINKLRKEGYFLVTISGSFHELVVPFANYHGFDIAIGELNEWGADGHFTGKTLRTTFKDKHIHLQKIVDENGLTFSGSYGVGDTIGDAEMLAMVENPIAFNPEKHLFDLARTNGWKIVVERKNVVYQLERGKNEYILA